MTDVSGKHSSILLLSSEPRIRAVLTNVLRDAGYLVLPASDLGVAVDTLHMCEIELLITHPYINCMPGHKAAKYLRQKNPGMAVLVVAGMLEDDRNTNRADFEQFHIFPKPFKASELVEEVRAVLVRRRKQLTQSSEDASDAASDSPAPLNSPAENQSSPPPLRSATKP